MTDAPASQFELANVGPGPDPCSLTALARDHEFVALLLFVGPDRPGCRDLARRVRDRYDAFRARNVAPAGVLPAERDRAADWQSEFDLPYPLLADPEGTVGEAYGQPDRLGFIGRRVEALDDYLGRMPAAAVVDARGSDPRVVWSYAGRILTDRPTTNEVVDAVDDHREAERGREASA